jgi:serine/threonine protein kinase
VTDDPRALLEGMQIHRESLSYQTMVGNGLTAEVYEGIWSGKPVAIKKLLMCSRRHAQMKQEVAFLRETAVASKVSHNNLVQLYGLAFETQPYLLVSEFCFGGTCFTLLHESDLELAMWQKVRMAIDTASAMEYLHDFRPQIIHRDLKSLNLLLVKEVLKLSDIPHVKVSDFGLSKIKDSDDQGPVQWGKMTIGAGTSHWMAPEVSTGHYDEKADIYSYSMVLFEFLCQEVPFEELEPAEVLEFALKGNRPDMEAVPPSCPEQLTFVMQQCWNAVPKDRPSFKQVSADLQRIYNDPKNAHIKAPQA